MPRRNRAFVAPKSRGARKALRARIGPLRLAKVAPKTLARYATAAHCFYRFAILMFGMVAANWDELDGQLQYYIETLWTEGESRSLAGDTLSGVQHLLSTRRQIPGSCGLLRTWSSLELPERTPPLLPEL